MQGLPWSQRSHCKRYKYNKRQMSVLCSKGRRAFACYRFPRNRGHSVALSVGRVIHTQGILQCLSDLPTPATQPRISGQIRVRK